MNLYNGGAVVASSDGVLIKNGRACDEVRTSIEDSGCICDIDHAYKELGGVFGKHLIYLFIPIKEGA